MSPPYAQCVGGHQALHSKGLRSLGFLFLELCAALRWLSAFFILFGLRVAQPFQPALADHTVFACKAWRTLTRSNSQCVFTKNTRFGGCVRRHVAVPVQMILADIQNRRRVGV